MCLSVYKDGPVSAGVSTSAGETLKPRLPGQNWKKKNVNLLSPPPPPPNNNLDDQCAGTQLTELKNNIVFFYRPRSLYNSRVTIIVILTGFGGHRFENTVVRQFQSWRVLLSFGLAEERPASISRVSYITRPVLKLGLSNRTPRSMTSVWSTRRCTPRTCYHLIIRIIFLVLIYFEKLFPKMERDAVFND